MRRASISFLVSSLLLVPLFFHPSILFADQAKWYLLGILIPFAAIFGPLAEALQGKGLGLPHPQRPWLLLFLLASASLLWAPSAPLALRSLAIFAAGLGICATTVWWISQGEGNREERYRTLIFPLFVAGGLSSLYGLLQSRGFDLPGVSFGERRIPVSTFGNTNHASEFCAPLAAAVFAWAGLQKKALPRLLGLLLLGALAAYISAAWVRAGLIAASTGAAVAALLLMRGMAPRERIRLSGPVAALLIGFLLPHSLSGADAVERPAARSIDTVLVRQKLYAATLRMIFERPLFGWGEGNFAATFPPFRDSEEIWISSHKRQDAGEPFVEEPHNDYLLVGAELGLVGLALAGWACFGIARVWKRGADSMAAALSLAGLAALATNALFRSPLTNPSSALVFWTLLGIWTAETSRQARTEPATGRALAWIALPILLGVFFLGGRGFLGELHLASYAAGGRSDLSVLHAAVEYDPFDPKKWERLGMEANNQGQADQARAAFEEVVRLNPNHVAARHILGRLAINRGERANAETHLSWAARLDPTNPRIDFAFAWLAALGDDDDRARQRLREGIRHGGSLGVFREFGSKIEEIEIEKIKQGRAGDPSRALAFYSEHVALNPDDADTWFAMGQIFRNRGDAEEGRRLFARARRLFGIEYLRRGEAVEAEKQFRFYREFAGPEDPLPSLYRAAAALAQEDRRRAETLLREAAALGARQKDLSEPALEGLASDAALRRLLPP